VAPSTPSSSISLPPKIEEKMTRIRTGNMTVKNTAGGLRQKTFCS
jgi:hypothetical protein